MIYEIDHFFVDAPTRPLVSREEGGHIRIWAKDSTITDRTRLEPRQAIEFMRLSMVVGRALETAMNGRGIPVVKINYQDMGNWAFKKGETPVFHLHVFGRVHGVPHQPYPEFVNLPDRSSGFYEGFESLNGEDVVAIRSEMERLFGETRYADGQWGF
ncbi:MAG TPA: hypothetical protein VN420_03325 [Candidatus Fimivivens sp.]|nr:hypothetical protein [Candidatus Fimivivens sp.]